MQLTLQIWYIAQEKHDNFDTKRNTIGLYFHTMYNKLNVDSYVCNMVT